MSFVNVLYENEKPMCRTRDHSTVVIVYIDSSYIECQHLQVSDTLIIQSGVAIKY